MIQRHQRIVFWCLVACIVAMAALLVLERQRGRDRITALANNATLLDAPTGPTEAVTLELANDTDGTITAITRQIALPEESNARARALIDHLIAEYALPGSAHPLPSVSAVAEVFLLPLPVIGYATDTTSFSTTEGGFKTTMPVAPANSRAQRSKIPGGQLAVVDLRSAFANQHPSGVEVESLTLLSIVETLHANLPQIEQVRFLVDGQPRETLAGHAGLLQTYPVQSTISSSSNKPLVP